MVSVLEIREFLFILLGVRLVFGYTEKNDLNLEAYVQRYLV